MYHPWWLPAPAAMPPTCTHPTCNNAATNDRNGFALCFPHWLLAVQWEQPRITAIGGGGLWADS